MLHNGCYIGVDCGEQHHHLVLLNKDGKRPRRRRVSNRDDAIRGALVDLCDAGDGEPQIVLESLYGFSRRVVEIARDLGVTRSGT
ncbi:MAG: transposase [Acidobacteriota bacterium]